MPDGSSNRIGHILDQIKGTASFIKQGIAKEIKLCLVDPNTNEIKEVYKFSAKAMVGAGIGGDDGMNAAMKQKRLLDMVEGFFLQIDVEMNKFKVWFSSCFIQVFNSFRANRKNLAC